jgi:ABC-type polysaccharide/polyol phosphate export permease
MVIALAGLVGVPYAPTLLLAVFAIQLLLAFAITAFGVMVAARIKQIQSFMAITQMVMMPMYFLSGAIFPVSGLPAWLTVLNRLDPMTYAVDPMRRLVFNHLHISAAARRALDPGVTWWGWHVPGLLEVAVVAAIGLVCLAGAVGVPYNAVLIVEVFAIQLALAFAITAFGVMVAARIKQIQSFMAITQMVMMPMYFLSGAIFPVSGLPQWLTILNRIDPMTYAVDPMRRIVFSHLKISAVARATLDPGVTWWGWHVPALLEAGVVVLIGLACLGVAIVEFSGRE